MKLNLGAFEYTVFFQENDGEKDFGSSDIYYKRIFINSLASKQIQKETLLHELLHVSLEDIYLFKHPIKDHEEMEEAIVSLMSPKLFQFLRDNKHLREFLFE